MLINSLGTKRSIRPLHVADESRIEQLLRGLQKYYAQRGINLRRLCADFDTHNIGVINESQVFSWSVLLYIHFSLNYVRLYANCRSSWTTGIDDVGAHVL